MNFVPKKAENQALMSPDISFLNITDFTGCSFTLLIEALSDYSDEFDQPVHNR